MIECRKATAEARGPARIGCIGLGAGGWPGGGVCYREFACNPNKACWGSDGGGERR